MEDSCQPPRSNPHRPGSHVEDKWLAHGCGRRQDPNGDVQTQADSPTGGAPWHFASPLFLRPDLMNEIERTNVLELRIQKTRELPPIIIHLLAAAVGSHAQGGCQCYVTVSRRLVCGPRRWPCYVVIQEDFARKGGQL